MDSKNSGSLEEILNEISAEDTDTEAETEETNASPEETEAEFEFSSGSKTEQSDSRDFAETESITEEASSAEASEEENDLQSDDSDSEYVEPVIRDEHEKKEEKTIYFTRLSGKSEIIRNEESDSTEKPSDSSSDQPAKNNVFSGPVSDDTPSDEYEADEDVFRNKRQSFSYSSTRKKGRTNRVILNPEDNIRYVSKETDQPKKQPDTYSEELHPPRRVLTEEPDEKEISESEQSSVSEKAGSILDSVRKFKNDIFGIRNISERHEGIDLKSVPEVEYFSLDYDNGSDEEPHEKPKNFFRGIRDKFKKQPESGLDDYNAPSDASLILDDLYSLKTSLTVKFYFQLAATLLSVYLSATAIYSIPVPSFVSSAESPHKFSFAMFMISALVLFSSFPAIMGGFKNLFHKKADCDSLAAVSLTVSTAAAAISTESPELIQSGVVSVFAPVAITAFLANTIGKHLIVERAINNFDMLISSPDKYSLEYVDNESKAEQLTKGAVRDYPILAAARKTGFAADFLRYSYSSDMADKLCRKFVPASLVVSVVLTLLSVILCSRTMDTLNITFITSMLSLFVSICSCFGIPIVVNLPLASAASEAEENESLILGYQSIDDFYDTNSVILTSDQLFPDTSLSLHSVKMYSDTKIDDALVTAASIIIKSGSIFTGMFRKIIDNRESLLENVENFFYEDSNGLCGWIKNKRVLMGTRELMTNHNIEGVPPLSREEEILESGCIPLYLSVSGNLAAVFSVGVRADKKTSEYVSELADNGISLIIRSTDSIITGQLISALFDIPKDMIRIIPSEFNAWCDKLTAPVQSSSSSVICSGRISSVAKVINNIRNIHHSSLTGLVLQGTSVLLALFFAVLFICIGVAGQITPLMVILYHTVWVFLTIFIMKVKPR